MDSLKNDLKSGEFQQIYLLYGDESYLKRYYKKELTKAIVAEGDTFNYNYFEGKGIVVNELIGLAETLPFFSGRRLIVIEDSGFFKKATPDLAEYLVNMPESTYMVFLESEIDKRGKMYTVVNKMGHVVEVTSNENMLKMWVTASAKKCGKAINTNSIFYLFRKVGTDMERLSNEMDKLIAYVGERSEITIQDIDEMCATQLLEKIFVLMDSVAEKKQGKAVDYYNEFVAAKEEPIKILSMIVSQYRMIYKMKQLAPKHYSDNEFAKILGCKPFVAKKCRGLGRSFENHQLREMIEEGIETDEAIKTGRLTDKIGVELYIVKCSMS